MWLFTRQGEYLSHNSNFKKGKTDIADVTYKTALVKYRFCETVREKSWIFRSYSDMMCDLKKQQKPSKKGDDEQRIIKSMKSLV